MDDVMLEVKDVVSGELFTRLNPPVLPVVGDIIIHEDRDNHGRHLEHNTQWSVVEVRKRYNLMPRRVFVFVFVERKYGRGNG